MVASLDNVDLSNLLTQQDKQNRAWRCT